MRDFDIGQIQMSAGLDIDDFIEGPSGGEHTRQSMLSSIPVAGPDFEMGSIETSAASGLDAMFFEPTASTNAPTPGLDALFNPNYKVASAPRPGRVRVASIQQLAPFTRVSSDTLIHKSDNALWALRKEADGNFYVERLFHDDGQPLKG